MNPRENKGALLGYSAGYFLIYTLFGVLLKWFQAPASRGFPGQTDMEFLVYSTAGSALACLGVILARGWWRAPWSRRELLYIPLAGTATALVIPATKLIYSLPVSVMVAMIVMRGSVIVLSRITDSLLLRRGLTRRAPGREENAAALLALIAIGLKLLSAESKDFRFLASPPAMALLLVYLLGYGLRIFWMAYFKVTHARDPVRRQPDKRNYFALEQLSASFWVFGYLGVALWVPGRIPGGEALSASLADPNPFWWQALLLAGVPFGIGSFFSAFLFLLEGRTATFSGLANRLSSLFAGTAATLLLAFFFQGPWPTLLDWLAFALLCGSVGLLGRAELSRDGDG